MYPEGTHIVLTEMAGESQMPYGLKGTVKFVDDAGQIHKGLCEGDCGKGNYFCINR
ncbi:DUF4314 domain-containing protein [Ruminococcus bicirculans (ex Wegman et al. 2014)]|uniref:DUF4314 domain-containing protein n=2 Tax=Ruminococcus TaxID=1263 RepID=UPI001A9AB30C